VRDLPKLTGFRLVQSLDEHIAFLQDVDACRFERYASSGSIFEEEVANALAVDHESASALDAHPGASQSVAHLGKCAGAVLECDRQVLHGSSLKGTAR
jgi:hypothetical protein